MASAPYLIPQSRDPADTRPDASGRIPAVHYNVPMYQTLPTQGPDPGTTAMGPIGRVVAGVIGGGAHDLKANLNPLTTTGLINLAGIAVPGGMKGEPTLAQQQFLNSIRESSTGLPLGHYPEDQSVKNLAQVIGEPKYSYAPGGYVAHDAFEGIKSDSPGAGLRSMGGSTPVGMVHDYGLPRNEVWSHFINYLSNLRGTGDYHVHPEAGGYTRVTNMNTGRSGLYDTVTGEFAHNHPERANVDVLAGFNPSGLNRQGITGSQATRDALLAYLKLVHEGPLKGGTASN